VTARATLEFTKLEGAGNDYVFVDAFHAPFDEAAAPELARAISDRHLGVGADGLIVLARSARADARMLMWNADGSRGAMCGNGIRCLAKFARETGAVAADALRIETDAGVHQVELLRDARGAITGARVHFPPATVAPAPAEWQGRRYHHADVGNPHAVVFTDADPAGEPLAAIGTALQRCPNFPDGVNVEVVRVRPDGALEQRTWERGSGETLACGTGATAAAAVALATGRVPGPRVAVHLRGGTLHVQQTACSLVLEGPARTVFRGSFEWPRRSP
jgi:diaminopimelate epimerase